jgi:hypothetical protein
MTTQALMTLIAFSVVKGAVFGTPGSHGCSRS